MSIKLILILLFGLLLNAGCAKQIAEQKECTQNSDCVSASCCHPKECVPKLAAPDCSGMFCTEECAPGTMDCGQGSCACDNGLCSAKFS